MTWQAAYGYGYDDGVRGQLPDGQNKADQTVWWAYDAGYLDGIKDRSQAKGETK